MTAETQAKGAVNWGDWRTRLPGAADQANSNSRWLPRLLRAGRGASRAKTRPGYWLCGGSLLEGTTGYQGVALSAPKRKRATGCAFELTTRSGWLAAFLTICR